MKRFSEFDEKVYTTYEKVYMTDID